MSSENKTPNLELNQWKGNEYPKRTDFIEDNKKIDEAYKELKDSIKDGGKVSSVNGKIGDVVLKAEDIKTESGDTVQSQMADITKQVESIEVTAEKTTLNSEKFTSKNVKAGMEELFTFADNGKKNIATVIGSPLSSTDTFDNMKSKIQTMKNTFARNLTTKGQNSNGSETLDNLINKVASISYMKVVSGIVHSSRFSTTIGTEEYGTVELSYNFNFNPQFIIIMQHLRGYTEPDGTIIYIKGERVPSYNGEVVFVNNYYNSTVRLVSPLYINSNGFYLPVYKHSYPNDEDYKYFVFGV